MKRFSTTALMFFLLVVFSATAVSAQQRPSVQQSGSQEGAHLRLEAHHAIFPASVQSGSQERVRAYLNREIRHELIMLPYYSVFDWLQFSAQPDGKVTLQGQVTRPTLKSDAERVVKDVEGVTEVVNQIEVLPLSPNDDRIRRAVYRTLFNFNSPLFRYSMGAVPPIHIIVKNGNVTLKGIVDREADKNLAGIRVNGVSGVFSVKNELVVGGKEQEAARQ